MFNEINLFDELDAINKENKLKKKLQENIHLSYMSKQYELQKTQRLKVFQQIQYYLKRRDLDKLKDFVDKNMVNNKNIIKNSIEKLEYTSNRDFLGNKKRKKEVDDLENSKDRLTFLNRLVTTQANGYDPIKNFMQKYRMQSKIVKERRMKEMEKRLKFLKIKEDKRSQNNLLARTRDIKATKRKVLLANKSNKNYSGPLKKKDFIQPIVKFPDKLNRELKLEEISYKEGDITENTDFLYAGMYKLPQYNKAIIFKFLLNFEKNKNKVIDLLDNDGDLLLHINFRENGKVILNSNIENMWGKEVIITKEIERNSIIKILSKNDYYKILCDEKILTFFIQRKVSKMSFLSINDNIRDFVFKIM